MQAPKKILNNNTGVDAFNPFASTLDVPPPVKEYAEKQGWELRWLDSKTIYDQQGYHPRGWSVFVLPDSLKLPADTLKFGRDPEGVLRRGTMLLGYKSKEAHKAHRAYLDQRAEQVRGREKQNAQDIRKQAKAKNLDAVVYEGFEENDG